MKPLVIYHDHCTDGFAAAYAAWLCADDDVEYLPMSYGKPLDAPIAGRNVCVLDFSFPRETMDRVFAEASEVVWLDHHKTAFEMYGWPEDVGMLCGADIGVDERHYVDLNTRKSGAMLAWEHFQGAEPPAFVRLIDDRDRWVFAYGEQSKEFHAALQAMRPWTFEQWDSQVYELEDELVEIGGYLLKAQDKQVEQIAKHGRYVRVAGDHLLEGLAANTPILQSEVGHELANESGTFGLCWYLAEDGVCCSFRSNGDYDVSAIARLFGGGGHRNAAGCCVPINKFLEWLK